MSRSDSHRFPVSISKLPTTRCDICGKSMAYRPGQASAVLTAHYTTEHADMFRPGTGAGEPGEED